MVESQVSVESRAQKQKDVLELKELPERSLGSLLSLHKFISYFVNDDGFQRFSQVKCTVSSFQVSVNWNASLVPELLSQEDFVESAVRLGNSYHILSYPIIL